MTKKLPLAGLCNGGALFLTVCFLTFLTDGVTASNSVQSTPSLQPDDQPKRPHIVWHKRMANGVNLGAISEPDTLGGKPTRTTSPYSVKPKDFINDDIYYGELPNQIRTDRDFAHFILHGTARDNPDDGTVLNIDGAVIGFLVRPNKNPDSEGYARLAVKTIGADGSTRWVPLNILLHLIPGQRISLPKLAVHFNRQTNTWALYLKDIIIQDKIPLLGTDDVPTISVRAGRFGDTARLLDLKIAKAPPHRGQRTLKARDGRIDLKKEYEAGNSRVKAFGLSR